MPKVRFVLTGFGPFGTVDDNPTSRVISWLEQLVSSGNVEKLLGQDVEILSTTVLPVAAVDVDDFVASCSAQYAKTPPYQQPQEQERRQQQEQYRYQQQQQQQQHEPRTDQHGDGTSPEHEGTSRDEHQPLVLLHFGVATKAAAFRLERLAANDASFRMPDARGCQPRKQEIAPGRGLLTALRCGLPLESICEQLAGQGYNVEVSDNAGRFLCNYVYYRSTAAALAYGQWHSLFVHVPSFETVDEATQREFVVAVVRAVVDHVGRAQPVAEVALSQEDETEGQEDADNSYRDMVLHGSLEAVNGSTDGRLIGIGLGRGEGAGPASL